MKFVTAALTKTGGRDVNEDFFSYIQLDDCGCWVLADGLGGHCGGECASRLAVESVLQSFQVQPKINQDLMRIHFENAQQAVTRKQKEDSCLEYMCTTLVVLISDYNTAVWGHIGDSRLYYFRNGQLLWQTTDHSVAQALVNAGEIKADQLRHHPERHRLMRAVGNDNAFKPVMNTIRNSVQPGDVFLLCSDGFWEHITETEMQVEMVKVGTPEEWLKQMELRVIARAKSNHDNYTAVAIFVM